MEDITYPYNLDIERIRYVIFPDEIICCVEGIWFINHENNHFGLEPKLKN